MLLLILTLILIQLVSPYNNGYLQDKYDYIIIGGGGAGCVVARTLSDAGHRVLLIERGDRASVMSEYPRTLGDAFIAHPDLQAIVTSQGVRTAVGSSLGGGTSISLGIWIEEDQTYYDKIHSLTGYTQLFANQTELNQAQQWARSKLASQQAGSSKFIHQAQKIVSQVFGTHKGTSPKLLAGQTWTAHGLFDNDTRRRKSTASLLFDSATNKYVNPSNLNVLTGHTALSIDFDRCSPYCDSEWAGVSSSSDCEPEATCVVFRKAVASDFATMGVIDPETRDLQLLNARITQNFLKLHNKSDLLTKIADDKEADLYPYRACLDRGNPKSEIILTAGAIHSPLLMFRSGVGPVEDIEALRVPLVKAIPAIGKNLADRIFVPLAFYLKSTAEESEPQIASIAGLMPVESRREDLSGRSSDHSDSYSGHSGENFFDDPVTPFEELTGGSILHGSMIASRILWPPEWRHTIFGELTSSFMRWCARNSADTSGWFLGSLNLSLPLPDRLNEVVCRLLTAVRPCFQQSFAWWSFSAHVSSRGFVSIDPHTREPHIQPNYLQHADDLDTLAFGVQRILKVIHDNVDVLESILVPVSEDKCPRRVFESKASMLKSIAAIASQHTREHRNLTMEPPEVVETSLPFASFPQSLPATDDFESIREFARKHGTSMWHFVGSMQLGEVLGSNFEVKGLRRVSVMDASALPLLPRMNPTATLVTVARLGAARKALSV